MKPDQSNRPWIARDGNLAAVFMAIVTVYVLWAIFTQGAMPCDSKFCT